MKPAPFRYLRPAELGETVAVLAEHGDEAKLLAGGQSLLPAMNFRLAEPAVLIDLELVRELRDLTRENELLRIGAMVTQRQAERSKDVRSCCPLLSDALPWIGHIQNRSRGTVGGSVAHADPAAELPAVCLAVGADIDLASKEKTRTVPATDFFVGPFMTVVEPDEVMTSIRFPVMTDAQVACLELAPRRGDFAVAGVAAFARIGPSDGRVEDLGIAAFGVGATPLRLRELEAQLHDVVLDARVASDAGTAAADEVRRPTSDIHATGEYRRRAVAELVTRALEGFASVSSRAAGSHHERTS